MTVKSPMIDAMDRFQEEWRELPDYIPNPDAAIFQPSNLPGPIALLELRRILKENPDPQPANAPMRIAAINPAAGGGRMGNWAPIIDRALKRIYGNDHYIQCFSKWVNGTAQSIEPFADPFTRSRIALQNLIATIPLESQTAFNIFLRQIDRALESVGRHLTEFRQSGRPNYEALTDEVLQHIEKTETANTPTHVETNSGDGGIAETDHALYKAFERDAQFRDRTAWNLKTAKKKYNAIGEYVKRIVTVMKDGAGTAGDGPQFFGGPYLFDGTHPDDYITLPCHTVDIELKLIPYDEGLKERFLRFGYRIAEAQPLLKRITEYERVKDWVANHPALFNIDKVPEDQIQTHKTLGFHSAAVGAGGELFVINEKLAEWCLPKTTFRPFRWLKKVSRIGGIGYQFVVSGIMSVFGSLGAYNTELDIVRIAADGSETVIAKNKPCMGTAGLWIPYVAGAAGVPGANLFEGKAQELILPATSLGAVAKGLKYLTGDRPWLNTIGGTIRAWLNRSPIQIYALDTVASLGEAVVRGAGARLLGLNWLSPDAQLITMPEGHTYPMTSDWLDETVARGDKIAIRAKKGGLYFQQDGTGCRAGLVREVIYTRGARPPMPVLAHKRSPAAKMSGYDADQDPVFLAREHARRGSGFGKLWNKTRSALNFVFNKSPDLTEARLNPKGIPGVDALTGATSAFAVGAYAYDQVHGGKWSPSQFNHVIERGFGLSMDLAGLATLAAGGSAITFHMGLLGMLPLYGGINWMMGHALDAIVGDSLDDKQKIVTRELLSAALAIGVNLAPLGKRWMELMGNAMTKIGVIKTVQKITPFANLAYLGKVGYNGVGLWQHGLTEKSASA